MLLNEMAEQYILSLKEEYEKELNLIEEEINKIKDKFFNHKRIVEGKYEEEFDKLIKEDIDDVIDDPTKAFDFSDVEDKVKIHGPGKVEYNQEDERQLMYALAVLVKQINAARKALGMLNKMEDSPFRTVNRSRVMGNLNRIRATLRRVEKAIDQYIDLNS